MHNLLYAPQFVFVFFGRGSIFFRSSPRSHDGPSPSLPPYKLKCVVCSKVQK